MPRNPLRWVQDMPNHSRTLSSASRMSTRWSPNSRSVININILHMFHALFFLKNTLRWVPQMSVSSKTPSSPSTTATIYFDGSPKTFTLLEQNFCTANQILQLGNTILIMSLKNIYISLIVISYHTYHWIPKMKAVRIFKFSYCKHFMKNKTKSIYLIYYIYIYVTPITKSGETQTALHFLGRTPT